MADRVPTKISAKHFNILVLSSSTCRSMVLWKVPTFLLLWTQRVTFTSNYLALLLLNAGLLKILKVGTFLLPSKLIRNLCCIYVRIGRINNICFFFSVGCCTPFPKDVYRLKQLNVGGVITLKEPYETLVLTSFYQARDIDHPVIPTRDIAHPVIPTRDYLSEVLFLLCDLSLKLLNTNRHMTLIAALEYVRSRRPRVLLAPSQWKVKPPCVP
ncbi:putative protein-tyrosine phosphatase [Helianthus anomalus]